MKFHLPSFLMGVGVTVLVMRSRERLRPVAVEVGAIGSHLAQVFRGAAERQRENAEDLWAEVQERVRERTHRGARA